MLRILTVVGARPQFVKAAVVSRLIRDEYSNSITEFLVHTGQHYDRNMSEVFFEELKIPRPDTNLEIGSGTHGAMTGRMLESIESVLLEQRPDWVLVYGDTNSTLAGTLASTKLNIPVAHVEAGLRSFARAMPEEQNRVVTDHLATVLFCPTETARTNLAQEGISDGVEVVGDVMYDASLYYREVTAARPVQRSALSRFGLGNAEYYLATIHRAENTDDETRLRAIVEALNDYREVPGLIPLHPRTRKALAAAGLSFAEHIRVVDPVGYLDMVELESKAKFVVTDSGGVQKEAFFFRKPCITLRDQTEWVETVEAGWNKVVGADTSRILQALHDHSSPETYVQSYGNGHAGNRILRRLGELNGT